MSSGRVITRSTSIARTARVLQLEGLFDVPPAERSEQSWTVDLPLAERPWSIGLIVGPSGAGKSTVARELLGAHLCAGFEWPNDKSVVDAFPVDMSIKNITALLSSVGFSSPPAWLRPFRVLSTGEQFRVTMARALAESPDLAVVDEFTSVVDRTVAQIGSAAIAKTVRRRGQQFVAVTCHYDVEDWLQPDWVYQPHINRFQWRELQRRPAIELRIERCPVEAWSMFRQHHYLSAELNCVARCFVALWHDRPVAFAAVLPMTGRRGMWRGHRIVTLPDFQGVGLGMRFWAAIGGIVKAATGGRTRGTTCHPALIAAFNASPDFRLVVAPSMRGGNTGKATRVGRGSRRFNARLVATHEYVGPAWPDASAARQLWGESFTRKKAGAGWDFSDPDLCVAGWRSESPTPVCH
jgi:ABC-type molybdenum transport system ATPase subunit/photorepair protein PhrA/GNAT superfamily N-acetyltransferase